MNGIGGIEILTPIIQPAELWKITNRWESLGNELLRIKDRHDRDFVVRDFNNSIKIANEWILIHDMIPPSIKYTASKFCSDSFRVLHHLLSKTDMTVYPMDENYGLTLIKLPGTSIELEQDSNELSWQAFVEFMKDKKVYSHSEVNQILRNTHV